MANPSKAKGTRWETAVVRFLRDAGLYAIKPRQEGFQDVGDIHVAGLLTLQAKDYKDLASALRNGTDGARVQRVNAGLAYGAAVIKRARRPVEDAYVVFRLGDLPELVRALTRAEALYPSDTEETDEGGTSP
jgi:hypothetical protein